MNIKSTIILLLLQSGKNHCCAFCTGAVRQNKILHKPSDSEIENAFKNWLRLSSDRVGGSRVRKRKLGSKCQWSKAHVSCTESNTDRPDD